MRKKLVRTLTGAIMAGGIAAGGASLAAPAANAAPPSTWDQVAQCESGGDWHINTGNGYYGGLQFAAQTWSGYGGGEFAATADQAAREQQIQIGERVLAGQGPGAWPNCGGPLA
jgi:ABC-type transport system substrate-binding protein